jgi:hypothetical protein
MSERPAAANVALPEDKFFILRSFLAFPPSLSDTVFAGG